MAKEVTGLMCSMCSDECHFPSRCPAAEEAQPESATTVCSAEDRRLQPDKTGRSAGGPPWLGVYKQLLQEKEDGSQDTRRIEGGKPKAGIKVMSVFGQSRIEITDGVNKIAVDLTRNGVESLIEELQIVLDMAD